MPSRWADSAADQAEEARLKAEKEEKKRRRAEKKQKQAPEDTANNSHDHADTEVRDTKRRRVAEDVHQDISTTENSGPRRLPVPGWRHCRSLDQFHVLNAVEEGSYGHVLRAREKSTEQIVAVKKLKMDPIRDGGFPVTALREIQCLQKAKHRHVVGLREVVADEQDVFLVMDFVEHDLKSLQEEMDEPFTLSEIKTLMLQLGSAIEFLHDQWILHRDLKTSNILMNNRGEIKLADFGMARLSGDPTPSNLTQLVVTLWYRAPELLLGAKVYDSAIDIWSLGCIFGELLLKVPLLQGKTETDQITKIFELCGEPNDDIWPGFKRLPNIRHIHLNDTRFAQSKIEAKFPMLAKAGLSLLSDLLALDPARRPSASAMLSHAYFSETPRPKPTAMFPTFPSKAGQERRRRHASPRAPIRGQVPDLTAG